MSLRHNGRIGEDVPSTPVLASPRVAICFWIEEAVAMTSEEEVAEKK